MLAYTAHRYPKLSHVVLLSTIKSKHDLIPGFLTLQHCYIFDLTNITHLMLPGYLYDNLVLAHKDLSSQCRLPELAVPTTPLLATITHLTILNSYPLTAILDSVLHFSYQGSEYMYYHVYYYDWYQRLPSSLLTLQLPHLNMMYTDLSLLPKSLHVLHIYAFTEQINNTRLRTQLPSLTHLYYQSSKDLSYKHSEGDVLVQQRTSPINCRLSYRLDRPSLDDRTLYSGMPNPIP